MSQLVSIIFFIYNKNSPNKRKNTSNRQQYEKVGLFRLFAHNRYEGTPKDYIILTSEQEHWRT